MPQNPKARILALTILITSILVFTFPAQSRADGSDRGQSRQGGVIPVSVSVFDDVGVPWTVLAQAEQRAARIFDRSGLEVNWVNCSARAKISRSDLPLDPAKEGTPVERPDPVCVQFDGPAHFAVRVVARADRFSSEVLGVAFLSAEGRGRYSDVFYDRAIGLHSAANVSLTDVLGSVMAHELGHLLLGSDAHSGAGIMRRRWENEELRLMSRGNLGFTNEQGRLMRENLLSGADVQPQRMMAVAR